MNEEVKLVEELKWYKSSRSNSGGGCVEVARLPDGAGMVVRDSKKGPKSPVLSFTAHEWECFLAGAAGGEFSL